jgi:hypothetical protein
MLQTKTCVAVDPLNACILLMKMECNQFNKQREQAWSTESVLTKRGALEYDKVFQGINCLDFSITIIERDLTYDCNVSRNIVRKRSVGNVIILKEPVRGLYFGTCTCGVDKCGAIPCKHMAALVVSLRIASLTQYNIMPYWWTTAQWRKQFPKDVVV